MWGFILTTIFYINVYVCTEMKITFSFKQTVYWGGGGVHFFSIHLPVLTSSQIIFCFMVCVPQSLWTTVILYDASTSVLLYWMVMMQTPICCAKWTEKFYGDISNLAPLCPVFSQHVPPACSLGTCYPKTWHLFVNYFLCISGTSGNLHLNLWQHSLLQLYWASLSYRNQQSVHRWVTQTTQPFQ
jgi:hypothetical protein